MGIEVTIGIDVKRTIGFVIGKHLIRTYCCRFGAELKSCPKVRVCLSSNIYCTISCSIKGCLIMTIFNTIKCFHVAPFPVTPFLVITFHVVLFLVVILTVSKGHFKSLLGLCQLQGRFLLYLLNGSFKRFLKFLLLIPISCILFL